MTASSVQSGGCQCGAVRYSAHGPLHESELCHCRMCQKAHGAPAVAWATLAVTGLKWTRGAPAQFASSALALRLFCNLCGTPLAFQRKEAETIDIALATLDRPQNLAPEYQGGVESRMPWFETAHLLREERMDDPVGSNQHPDHDTDHWP